MSRLVHFRPKSQLLKVLMKKKSDFHPLLFEGALPTLKSLNVISIVSKALEPFSSKEDEDPDREQPPTFLSLLDNERDISRLIHCRLSFGQLIVDQFMTDQLSSIPSQFDTMTECNGGNTQASLRFAWNQAYLNEICFISETNKHACLDPELRISILPRHDSFDGGENDITYPSPLARHPKPT
ncbi:hypothetical protein BHE74_00042829 [Ensete ventricosum]|nr:hypothetical protein BHE74_00042829 [Ensete ventricosum]